MVKAYSALGIERERKPFDIPAVRAVSAVAG